MADDPDNLVLSLLREMRQENRQRFDAIDKRFDAVENRIDAVEDRLETIKEQVTGMGGVIYAIYAKLMTQEERIEALELVKGTPAE